MSSKPQKHAIKAREFKRHNLKHFGITHVTSSKAASTVGLEPALILSHLYYLQKMVPKGGHIPTTSEGERASYSTFEQLYYRFPFIPIRTIKSQLGRLKKNLPGFTNFKYKGHSANHYHIDNDLIESLDLDCTGAKIYVHEKEAIAHGTLCAAILQTIGYTNAYLVEPMKQSRPFTISSGWKKFGVSRKTVDRAMQSLTGKSVANYPLVVEVSPGEFWVDDWSREHWIEIKEANHHAEPEAVKDISAHSIGPFGTPSTTELHSTQTNLPIAAAFYPSQVLVHKPDTTTPLLLNTLLNTESTKEVKIAGTAQHSFLPSGISIATSHDSASDRPFPCEASPSMGGNDGTLQILPIVDSKSSQSPQDSLEDESLEHDSSSFDIQMLAKNSLSDGNRMHQHLVLLPDEEAIGSLKYSIQVPVEKVECDSSTQDKWRRFSSFISNQDFLASGDTMKRFVGEVSSNPELTDEVLNSIYERILDPANESFITISDRFNPYFFSTGLAFANETISRFYLILTDMYRATGKAHFESGKGKDALRENTPQSIKRYIERKVKASNAMKAFAKPQSYKR